MAFGLRLGAEGLIEVRAKHCSVIDGSWVLAKRCCCDDK